MPFSVSVASVTQTSLTMDRGPKASSHTLRGPLLAPYLTLTSHFSCTTTPSRDLQPLILTAVRSTNGSTPQGVRSQRFSAAT